MKRTQERKVPKTLLHSENQQYKHGFLHTPTSEICSTRRRIHSLETAEGLEMHQSRDPTEPTKSSAVTKLGKLQ